MQPKNEQPKNNLAPNEQIPNKKLKKTWVEPELLKMAVENGEQPFYYEDDNWALYDSNFY